MVTDSVNILSITYVPDRLVDTMATVEGVSP